MPELPTVIALMAFAVSALSLTVSSLSYLRDRSKLRVSSNMTWRSNGPESDTPILKIQIANLGRRPVVLLNLVKRAGKLKWWRSIKRHEPSDQDTFEKQIEEIHRHSLAQMISIKLSEGEILELAFLPDDCPEFIATHEDPIVEATSLEIEDASGRFYPVKDSQKNLATLLKAWSAKNR